MAKESSECIEFCLGKAADPSYWRSAMKGLDVEKVLILDVM